MTRLSLPLFAPPVIRTYQGDIDADMACIRTIKRANEVTGGLSKPSKMPEWAYSIPAQYCKTGAKLHEVRGTVCQRCYALTNRYVHPSVTAALQRRFESLPHPLWVPAMVLLIGRREIEHFRWHDSGDVQTLEHLENIMRVAQETRKTLHWLPFREYGIMTDFLDNGGKIPENMVARASAHVIDGPPPSGFENTSTVTAARPDKNSHLCPAPGQGNVCGECRACWNRDIKNVVYWLH
jgi:hypothetical protein